MKRCLLNLYCIFFLLVYSSCSITRPVTDKVNRLTFLGDFTIPHRMQFEGTTVGGLSGIDYDAAAGTWYLVCDDRSDHDPARFYRARIIMSAGGIDSIRLTEVISLRRKNGSLYPNKTQDPHNVPDPEAIRYNSSNNTLLWSSEGERVVRGDLALLTDPSINITTADGKQVDTFSLPKNMRMTKRESGPRQNGVFEGLTFSHDYKSVYVSIEEPLFDDGPRAGTGDSAAWIRITKFDVESRKPVAQYGYKIDPVVRPSIPPGAFKVNGVPDILAINDRQLLVIERSYSNGYRDCNVRVYIADINKADEISNMESLLKQTFRPMKKKLLLDMDQLGVFIDNVEGASFGPLLPNGKRSIIFVADDNFSPLQKNQFLLFQVN